MATFRGAPLTKVIALSCFLGPLMGTFVSPSVLAAFTVSSPLQVLGPRYNFWRLVTSMLACEGLVAAGVSCCLLWNLRLFERQMGSSKFAAFLLSSGIFAASARVGLLLIPWVGVTGLASGPFHVIFGLLPLYFCASKRTHHVSCTFLNVAFSPYPRPPPPP